MKIIVLFSMIVLLAMVAALSACTTVPQKRIKPVKVQGYPEYSADVQPESYFNAWIGCSQELRNVPAPVTQECKCKLPVKKK